MAARVRDPRAAHGGLSLWFSALNVRYRDVGHLLNIALLVWFWATPIVYAEFQVQQLAQRGTWFGIPRLAFYLLNSWSTSWPASTVRSTAVEPVRAGAGPVRQEPRMGRRDPHDHVRRLARPGSRGVTSSRSGDFAEEL